MVCSDSDSSLINPVKKIKEEANKLILILEDMIDIILSSDDISSVSMRELKERTTDAKSYLNNLRRDLMDNNNLITEENYTMCKKELDRYDDEYVNDIVTTWILNGSKDVVMDKLYGACYKIREAVRKIN
jgi:hypothetical protein